MRARGEALDVGQVCVVKRSDGKMKFAVVKSRSASVLLRGGRREGV